MSNERYLRPASVEEALHLLAQGDSEILAGGTYLIGRQARRASRLIDLERLDLHYVAKDERGVRCGAMTRLQDLVDNELLGRRFSGMLPEAAQATRPSWMLRNMSTVGGEIVQRSRHSALVVALLTLDASVTVTTPQSVGTLKLWDFYRERSADTGPMVLTEVSIPPPKGDARVAFRRLAQLPSQEPITVAAVSLLCHGSRVREVRAALGSSVGAPQRLDVFEQTFNPDGPRFDVKRLRDCCLDGLREVEFAGGHDLSVDYLREMSGLLLTRICLELLEREGQTNGHSH
jgi:CO/xanthine dehydrogenase FAD-binding subunit